MILCNQYQLNSTQADCARDTLFRKKPRNRSRDHRGSEERALTREIAEISPKQLRVLMDSGEALLLLDVREVYERAHCRIAAPETCRDLHVPMNTIPSRLDELRGGDGPLVVYCHHGVRSLAVAHWLGSQGFPQVLNLEGGIDAWSILVDRTVPRY